MRKIVTPLIPAGNRVPDQPADKKTIPLQSTYGHDYPALDKRNCVEGVLIVGMQIAVDRSILCNCFLLNTFPCHFRQPN